MKWTGSIKAVQVEIKEDLHAAAKAMASLLGVDTNDIFCLNQVLKEERRGHLDRDPQRG